MEELIQKHGQPTSQQLCREAFQAHSYREDCFLVANRNNFHKRLEWKNEGEFNAHTVAYLDKNDQIIKVFSK